MSHRPHPPRRSSTTPSVASRNGNQVRVAGARRPSDGSSASIVLSVSTVSSPSSSPMGVGSSSQLPSHQYHQQQSQQPRCASESTAARAIRRHSANVASTESHTSSTAHAASLARSATVSSRPRPTSRVFIGNAIPPSAEAADPVARPVATPVSVRPSFSLRRRSSQRTLGTPRPRPAQPPSAPPPVLKASRKSGSTPSVNPLANCLAFLLCRTSSDRSSTVIDDSVAPIPLPAMYMTTASSQSHNRYSTGVDPRRVSAAPSAMSALDTGVTATLARDSSHADAGASSTSHVRGRTMSDVGSSPEGSPEVIPDPDPVRRNYYRRTSSSAATSPRSGASTPWSTVPAPRMPNRDTFSSALSSRSVDTTDDEGGYLTTDEAMSEYDVDDMSHSAGGEQSMSFADESEVEPEPVLVRKSTPLLASAAAAGTSPRAGGKAAADQDPAASMSIQYRYRASSSSMSAVNSGPSSSVVGPAHPPSAKSTTTVPTSIPSSYHVPTAPPPSTATTAAHYTAGPGATSISYRVRPTPPAPPPSAASHPPTTGPNTAAAAQADPGAYSITHRTAAGTEQRITVSPAKERAAFGNKWAGAWHPGWRATRAFVHSVFDLVGCSRDAVTRMYPLFRATRMTPQHFSVMAIYLARFLTTYRNTIPEPAAPPSPASASDDSRRSLDTVQLTRTRGALGSFKWKLGQAKKKLTKSASRSKLKLGEDSSAEVDMATDVPATPLGPPGVGESLDETFAAAWSGLANERLPFDRPTSVPSARAAAKSTGRSNIPPAERLARVQVRLLTVATLIACKVLNDHSFTAKAVSGVAPEKCFTGCPDLVALEMRVAVLLEFDFAVRRTHLRPLLEAVIAGAGVSRAMAAQQQHGSMRSMVSSANGRPATFAEPSTGTAPVDAAAEEAQPTIAVCRRLLRILDETMADLGEVDEIIDFPTPSTTAAQPHAQQHHVHYAMSPPGLSSRVDTMDSGHASVSSPQHYQHVHGGAATTTATTMSTSRRRNADSAVASTAHSATSSRRATPEGRKSSVPPQALPRQPAAAITVNHVLTHPQSNSTTPAVFQHTAAPKPVTPLAPTGASGRRPSRSRSRSRARSHTDQVPISPPPFPPPNYGPHSRSRSGSVVSAQAMLASLIHAADDVTAAATTNGSVHNGYDQQQQQQPGSSVHFQPAMGDGSHPCTPMPGHLGPQPAASTTPSTLCMVPSPSYAGYGPYRQTSANGQNVTTDYFHQHMHQPQTQQISPGYSSMPRILTPSIGHMSISSSGSSGTCHHDAPPFGSNGGQVGTLSRQRVASGGSGSTAMQALASIISMADVSPTSLRGSLHSPRQSGFGNGGGIAGGGLGAGSSSSGLSPASTLRPATADDTMCSATSSSVAPSMALSSTSEMSSRPASASDAGMGHVHGGLRHMTSLERVSAQAYASPIPNLRKSVSAANVLGPRSSTKGVKRAGLSSSAANKWNVPTLPTTEDSAHALASSLESIAASPSTVLSFGSGVSSSVAGPPTDMLSSTPPTPLHHPRPRVRQQAPRVVAHRRSMPPGLQSLMSPRAAALQRAGLIQLGNHSNSAANGMTSFSAPVTPTSAVPPPATAVRHPASVFSALPGSVHWPGSLASPSAVGTQPSDLALSHVSDSSTRSTFATAPTVLQPVDAQVWTSRDLKGGFGHRDQIVNGQPVVSTSSTPSSTKATIYPA